MKALKLFLLTLTFVLTLGIFSTVNAYTENPPNTYSVVTVQNGLKYEYVYSTVDGGVVSIKISVDD